MLIGAMRTPNAASTQASGEHHMIMASTQAAGGASHDLGDTVTSLVTEFFGGDVIGPSFIPRSHNHTPTIMLQVRNKDSRLHHLRRTRRHMKPNWSTAAVFVCPGHLIACRLSVVRKGQVVVVK